MREAPSPWRTRVRTPEAASPSSTWSTTTGWIGSIPSSDESLAVWRSSTPSAARRRTPMIGRGRRSQSGRPPCPPETRPLDPPEFSREAQRLEMGHELVLARSNVSDLQLVLVNGHAQRMRLFNRETGPLGRLSSFPPLVQVRFGGEEHHVVRAGTHDVIPPLRCGEREIDHRPWRRCARLPTRELDRDRFRAMMATAFDPDDFVQHRVERDRIPRAVRVVSSSDDRPGGAKRCRDGREREGHEDSLRAGHEFQVTRLLERFQDGERVGTLEVVSFHDLFEDGGNGVFQEMVEDVLPHVSRKRITGGFRHEVAFVRDGTEEGDKLAGRAAPLRGGNKSFRREHEVSEGARTV